MSSAREELSQFDISNEEKDKLVGEVTRYILFKTEQSNGCPIKREELTQIITKKNYRQKNLPTFVINEAKSKLSSIFGYELRELQRSRPSSATQGRASSSQQYGADAKSYIIVSQLPADVYKKYVENDETSHVTGFTFVVLGIIHLAGGKITEDNLWHHLRRLGLCENEESHPILGKIKLALEALVQQRYLQKDKVSGPEGNTLLYEFAERALDDAIKSRIQEYISQIVQRDVSQGEAD
ncbi:hypothetical protein ACH5RR_000378 [Cinchona calisaya]|uniref:MAGE domain-containing protein n=1 Tax=Cinchona calisaya TaxID=153742 RepID=A0ABD3B1I7_9GENT